MIDESYILGLLERRELPFPPLEITRTTRGANGRQRPPIDAILETRWGKRRFRFAVACKAYSTPKMIREATDEAQRAAPAYESNPLVVVPYLDETRLKELEAQQVSGIDLCGNGVVVVPNELLLFRTGNPNRFPQSTPIKNIYKGASALVPRVLLARPRYPRVGAVLEEIRRRDGALELSTVSKVLKSLEDAVLVAREAETVRLLQPADLLDALQANFQAPKIRSRLVGKTTLAEPALFSALAQGMAQRRARWALTGVSSGIRYAVAGLEPIVSVYVSQPPETIVQAGEIPFEATSRFPNLEFLWTDDPTAYFDLRIQDGRPYANPVQTYLEMMLGDKRLQQTAEQVRASILEDLRQAEAR